MGRVDPELLLSLGDLWGPLGLLLILAALPVVLLVAARPRLLWPFLIVAAIIGVGPRIRGYMLLDEALIYASLAGALLHLALRPPVGGPYPARPLDRVLFFTWTLFMVVQSIRGVLVLDDPRIVRWVVLYGAMGLLFVVVNHRGRYFPFPAARTACVLILASTALSYVAYLAQGAYYDATLGPAGRFLSQDWFWAGSAIAVFPTLAAVPAALLLADDPSARVRALAWLTAALMIAVAFYFQSRISWFVMLAFAPVAWRFVRPRQALAAAALVLALFTGLVGNPVAQASGFVEELVDTSRALWAPTDSDIGRSLQVRAGFETIGGHPLTFLVGTGVYVHRVAIVPAIERLFDEFMPRQTFAIPGSRDDRGRGLTIFRTTGFTALLIDTGVLGLIWFAAICALCAARVLALRSKAAVVLAMVVVVAFGWTLANNVLEVMLLYLLVMPGGLLQRLAQSASGPSPSMQPAAAR